MGYMRRIIITGAAGFIGFHTALALKELGDTVLGYDNFNPYYDPLLKEQRAAMLSEAGIEVIRGDIQDQEKLAKLFSDLKPTHCIHLAAQAGVRYSLTAPQEYVKSNIAGFIEILEICRCYPDIHLVYASSSSVYGKRASGPFKESDATDKPSSVYAATKKANELLAYTYSELYRLHVTGLRFFTVYGPWGRPDMAYFTFADALYHGRTIDLYGEGKLWRDFTYIEDIVSGVIAALDVRDFYSIFNLGNNEPVQVLHFLKVLEEALGKKAVVRLLPMQPGDVTTTHADISLSREKLGFKPKTSLADGLKIFCDWFLGNMYKSIPNTPMTR